MNYNNKKILERINIILNNNINIILNKLNKTPKIHYIDFNKIEKYKKSSPK